MAVVTRAPAFSPRPSAAQHALRASSLKMGMAVLLLEKRDWHPAPPTVLVKLVKFFR